MLFCSFLYNFTLFFFVFSVTHSGFNQKIITHILEIVFITRPRIFFITNSFKISYGIYGPQISFWSVVGWSVGWLLVVGGRLVGVLRKPVIFKVFGVFCFTSINVLADGFLVMFHQLKYPNGVFHGHL